MEDLNMTHGAPRSHMEDLGGLMKELCKTHGELNSLIKDLGGPMSDLYKTPEGPQSD